jgi:hypothetical protein
MKFYRIPRFRENGLTGRNLTGQFMGMKKITAFSGFVLMALAFAGCLSDPDESNSNKYKTTIKGELSFNDTISSSSETYWYALQVNPVQINSYDTSCNWVAYLGHSDSSSTYTNDLMQGSHLLYEFLLVAYKDSAFTHYRIEIDCTP